MKNKIYVDYDVYRKIMYWVDKAPGEISGLGKVQILEDGSFLVSSAILCKQVNTGTSTDIDATDLSKAMFALKDEPGELRFWWHSHANMEVFWSGTDWATIKELSSQGWFLSMVFNKKEEYRACLAQQQPIVIVADELDMNFFYATKTDEQTIWDKEFDAKCEAKKYTSLGNNFGPGSERQQTLGNWEETDPEAEPTPAYMARGFTGGTRSIPEALADLNDLPDGELPDVIEGDFVRTVDGQWLRKYEYEKMHGLDLDDPETLEYLGGAYGTRTSITPI